MLTLTNSPLLALLAQAPIAFKMVLLQPVPRVLVHPHPQSS